MLLTFASQTVVQEESVTWHLTSMTGLLEPEWRRLDHLRAKEQSLAWQVPSTQYHPFTRLWSYRQHILNLILGALTMKYSLTPTTVFGAIALLDQTLGVPSLSAWSVSSKAHVLVHHDYALTWALTVVSIAFKLHGLATDQHSFSVPDFCRQYGKNHLVSYVASLERQVILTRHGNLWSPDAYQFATTYLALLRPGLYATPRDDERLHERLEDLVVLSMSKLMRRMDVSLTCRASFLGRVAVENGLRLMGISTAVPDDVWSREFGMSEATTHDATRLALNLFYPVERKDFLKHPFNSH